MIRTSSIAATLLMLMSTASSLAASTQPLGPSQTGPVVTRDQGAVASPGDPFIPERPERADGTSPSPFSTDPTRQQKPRGITDPGYSKGESGFSVDCGSIHEGWTLITNTSDVTIPEDTWFAVSYPVNQVFYHKVPFALEPGHGVDFKMSASTGPGFDCEAWVWKDAEVPPIKEDAVP